MRKLNEQLDKLWKGKLPECTQSNAALVKRGLIQMERDNGVVNAGVHQVDRVVIENGKN